MAERTTTKNEEKRSDSRSLNRLLFSSPLTTLGSFRCGVEDSRFHNSGPTRGHLLVFPRYHVTITHEGMRPITADLNSVIFYNKDQHYWRDSLDERGDQSEWIAIRGDHIAEMVEEFEPNSEHDPDRPFHLVRGLIDAQSVLHQRQLFSLAGRVRSADASCMSVEESALWLVHRILELNYRSRGFRARRDPRVRKQKSVQELAEAARSLIAKNPHQNLGLQKLADRLQCSSYHLSRAFHAVMGMTLHGYQNRLKLFSSLDRLKDPDQDITSLAIEYGYSSHSHFSFAFRKLFGVPPSRLRTRWK